MSTTIIFLKSKVDFSIIIMPFTLDDMTNLLFCVYAIDQSVSSINAPTPAPGKISFECLGFTNSVKQIAPNNVFQKFINAFECFFVL